MNRKRHIFLVFSIILFMACPVFAQYAPKELCIIGWGDGADCLMIEEPAVNAPGLPNEDIWPGAGPSMGYVDVNEDIFFSSYALRQLKGYSNSGALLYNILGQDTQIDNCLNGRKIDHFIIDADSHIYIVAFPGLPYVPISDYSGRLIDTIFAHGDSSNQQIMEICMQPNGDMVFDAEIERIKTRHSDGQYTTGGSCGFLATNMHFYSAIAPDPHILSFNKYIDPDSLGTPSYNEISDMVVNEDSLGYAEILNGGDGSSLYVYVLNNSSDGSHYEVWEYDLEYNILGKAIFPRAPNKYDWAIEPFVSHDGTIYEFRCLDDGLHVVKWTKQ